MWSSCGLIRIIGPKNPISQEEREGSWPIRRTISPVQLLYLEGVASLADHIVVELVPQGCSCEFRAGKFREGTKVDTVHPASNKRE